MKAKKQAGFFWLGKKMQYDLVVRLIAEFVRKKFKFAWKTQIRQTRLPTFQKWKRRLALQDNKLREKMLTINFLYFGELKF